jgi:hypothetical protein
MATVVNVLYMLLLLLEYSKYSPVTIDCLRLLVLLPLLAIECAIVASCLVIGTHCRLLDVHIRRVLTFT